MTSQRQTTEQDRRRKPRLDLTVLGVVTADGRRSSTAVHNLSASGALLGKVSEVQPGQILKLDVPGHGTVAATVVRATASHTAVTFPADKELAALFGEPSDLFDDLQRSVEGRG